MRYAELRLAGCLVGSGIFEAGCPHRHRPATQALRHVLERAPSQRHHRRVLLSNLRSVRRLLGSGSLRCHFFVIHPAAVQYSNHLRFSSTLADQFALKSERQCPRWHIENMSMCGTDVFSFFLRDISGVMLRRPRTISLMHRGLMPMARARTRAF